MTLGFIKRSDYSVLYAYHEWSLPSRRRRTFYCAGKGCRTVCPAFEETVPAGWTFLDDSKLRTRCLCPACSKKGQGA